MTWIFCPPLCPSKWYLPTISPGLEALDVAVHVVGDKNYLKELCLGVAMRWRAIKSKEPPHPPLCRTKWSWPSADDHRIPQGSMHKGCGWTWRQTLDGKDLGKDGSQGTLVRFGKSSNIKATSASLVSGNVPKKSRSKRSVMLPQTFLCRTCAASEVTKHLQCCLTPGGEAKDEVVTWTKEVEGGRRSRKRESMNQCPGPLIFGRKLLQFML